ncbi:PLDc N-terminal domain-containing protein [Halocola ammonii]
MTTLAFIGPWQIVLLLIAFGIFILPIIALIEIVQNEFEGSNKIIWVLVVLLLPFLGSVLYFVIGRDQRLPK